MRKLTVLVPAIFAFTTAMAGTVDVTDAQVSGSSSSQTVTIAPVHSQGPDAITQVAVEIIGGGGVWSFPNLNDSGADGDATAGDGVWSLSVDLGNASAGSYEAIFYVTDTDGDEAVSTPVAFTVQ